MCESVKGDALGAGASIRQLRTENDERTSRRRSELSRIMTAELSSSITREMAEIRPRRRAASPGEIDPIRLAIGDCLDSESYNLLMASAIMFNMILVILETDKRHFNDQPDSSIPWLTRALLCMYFVDLALRIYVAGVYFFQSGQNIFDLCIVSVDGFVECLAIIDDGSTTQIPALAVLRVLRMLRLVRVIRNFLAFRELYLMMKGLVSALRAILFATLLIAVVLTVWGIIAVEFIHELNQKLFDAGVYGDCSRCDAAFITVYASILTFFSSIIAGDSWGTLALPLMEYYPSTGVVFLGALVTVQLGLLNLITAIIVDRAAAARADDHELLHTMRNEELEVSYNRLRHVFEMMDDDGSGALSREELLESYKTCETFRQILALMDIEQEDLSQIFDILDKDNDGQVSYTEFVEELHHVKNANSHTLLVFIVDHCKKLQDIMYSKSKEADRQFCILCDYVQALQLNGGDKSDETFHMTRTTHMYAEFTDKDDESSFRPSPTYRTSTDVASQMTSSETAEFADPTSLSPQDAEHRQSLPVNENTNNGGYAPALSEQSVHIRMNSRSVEAEQEASANSKKDRAEPDVVDSSLTRIFNIMDDSTTYDPHVYEFLATMEDDKALASWRCRSDAASTIGRSVLATKSWQDRVCS